MTSGTGAKRSGGLALSGALLVLLAAALIAAIASANVWKSGASAGTVRVTGNAVLSQNEIRALAAVDTTRPLYDLDLFSIRRRVAAHSFIGSVTVRRDVGSGIVIHVVERTPAAVLLSDRMYYLDTRGVVLAPARSEQLFDLPVITGYGRACVPGTHIDDPVLKEAHEIILTARAAGEGLEKRISEVRMNGTGDLVAITAEGGVPVIFGRGSVSEKVAALEAFWQEVICLEGPFALAYVDLRFRDQIVVRWRQAAGRIEESPAG